MKSATTLFSLIAAILMLIATSPAKAQDIPDQGTVGLTASIQNSQTNLQIPIWLNDTISLSPVFGFVHEQDNFTTINFGVTPRFYRNMGSNFASYLGARGIFQHTSPEIGADDTDLLLGATGGGEYFLDEHFSLGVEGQLNFLINDNGNDLFSTGAAIMGTYYF